MKITKLIELIDCLSKKEISELSAYISIKKTQENRLLKVYSFFKLKTRIPCYEFDKTEFSLYVFGIKEKDVKIRLLISDFCLQIERFLLYKSLNSNYLSHYKLLLEQFRQRGADKNYHMLASRLQKELAGKLIYSIYDYYLMADIESSLVMYRDNKLINHNLLPYSSTMKNYDKMYMLAKLHFHNLNIISRTPLSPSQIPESFLAEEIVKFIEINTSLFKKKDLLIYIEFLINKMLTDYLSYEKYHELKIYTVKNFQKLDIIYLTHIFYSFNTHLINKTNVKEEASDFEKFFTIVNIFYNKGFFDKYRLIPGSMFYNCINISLGIHKINFADEFFRKYRNKVESGAVSDIVKLSYVQILFAQGNYETAINEIAKINPRNMQVYLNSKIYLLLIYYKLGYIENIYYTIDALKHYLYRHKQVLGGWYERFKLLADVMVKTLNVNLKNKNDKIKFLKQLNSYKPFAGKQLVLNFIKRNF